MPSLEVTSPATEVSKVETPRQQVAQTRAAVEKTTYNPNRIRAVDKVIETTRDLSPQTRQLVQDVVAGTLSAATLALL